MPQPGLLTWLDALAKPWGTQLHLKNFQKGLLAEEGGQPCGLLVEQGGRACGITLTEWYCLLLSAMALRR